jgi:hypothetical protein
VITRDLLGKAIAESYKVSYINLKENHPAKEVVLKMSEEFAKNIES